MLKMRLIPCLDVKDGRVVKGVRFVALRDAGDPVAIAAAYDAAGADELCFLDITASHENRGIMLDVVRRTAEVCFIPLTIGGGVRTPEDINELLPRRSLIANLSKRLRSVSAASVSLWPLMPRRWRQTAGTSLPMVGARRPASMRLRLPAR
jgi:uncharacterized protein related to proFAR isomerase